MCNLTADNVIPNSFGDAEPSESVERLRRMLAYIDAIQTVEELRLPPNFGAHQLTGTRGKEWSMFVTKNWRMTFKVSAAGAIEDLDLEDYH